MLVNVIKKFSEAESTKAQLEAQVVETSRETERAN